jgi:monoamine oxidase
MMNGKGPITKEHDLVVMCLPHSWLTTMNWEGELLRHSMIKHIAYFDRPAHYLRVSILFDEPFWGDKVPGAWWMSEAFGGCCVYVEGARHDVGRNGVLNWLIPGSDALAFANLSDKELIDAAIKSLPKSFGDAQAFPRGQDPSLAVVGELHSRRLACARCDDQSSPEPTDHPGLSLSAIICSTRR